MPRNWSRMERDRLSRRDKSHGNKKFEKYNIKDRGGLKKSYLFTPLKRKNLLKKQAQKQRGYLEKRLRRR